MKLEHIVKLLSKHYGTARPPRLTDPLHLIIWENIGYLVDDERRQQAFDQLRAEVGLGPTDILAAPSEKLLAIAKLGGVHPEVRAQRLKEIAHIVLNDFDGDVSGVLKLPFAKAIKALRKFPSIGEPGAEKILLFTKAHPVLALESNGLRVLLRLGFGEEKKSYAASYKSVREVLEGQLPADFDFLIGAHELLRRHGKELCRRSNPHCDECPVREECQYYRRLSTRSVG